MTELYGLLIDVKSVFAEITVFFIQIEEISFTILHDTVSIA